MNSQVASVNGESRAATYSPCRAYRYELSIEMPGDLFLTGMCAFVGLNPSTATELQDDPTIRRIKSRVKGWWFSRLVMLNAYAFRSTDPKGLWTVKDPVGEGNDEAIARIAAAAGRICVAWGTHVRPDRLERLAEILGPHAAKTVCLGTNQDGSPKHPLYLPTAVEAVPFLFSRKEA